jgi:hypothetical protein
VQAALSLQAQQKMVQLQRYVALAVYGGLQLVLEMV